MQATRPRKRKAQSQSQRVIKRLLTALDKAILATEEAKKARDELVRLAQGGTP